MRIKVLKNKNRILWFIHVSVYILAKTTCLFLFLYSILLYCLGQFYQRKKCTYSVFLRLLNSWQIFLKAPQIWCCNISNGVKGLCSRVALLFAPEPDQLWIIPLVIFAFLQQALTHKYAAYNWLCAWMLVQVLMTVWAHPFRLVFSRQKELENAWEGYEDGKKYVSH